MVDRAVHGGHIVETGNNSQCYRHNKAKTKKRIKAREQTRKGTKQEAEPEPF